jgi:hypothetical protein
MPSRDEIVHNVKSWEDLLTTDDPIEVMPVLCTAATPLTMNMRPEVLVPILKAMLRAVKASRARLDKEGRTAETANWIAQFEELIAWIKSRPKKSSDVHMALYPHPMYKFVDEDDGDGDVPVVDCPPVLQNA